MSGDLEDRIGPALRARSDAIVAADDLAARALERGRTARRRRRVAGGALAVASAGVVAVVAMQGLPTSPDSLPAIPPSVIPTVDVRSDAPADLAGWIDTLPVGEPLRLPYTTPTELFDGSVRVPLPAPESSEVPTVYVVLARAGGDAGWILQYGMQSGDVGFPSKVGRLDPSGELVELIDGDFDLKAAVSPDGSMIASAMSRRDLPLTVVESAGGAELGEFELSGNEAVVGWADSGIVLVDQSTGASRLLRLDGTSEPIQEGRPVLVDRATDLAVLTDVQGCSRLVELADPEIALREFCESGVTMSPGGRWLFGEGPNGDDSARPYLVFDLDTGSSASLTPLAVHDGIRPIGWEDDDTVLLRVSVPREREPNAVGVVRCSVTSLECETVLPLVSLDGATPYIVMTSTR